MRPHRVVTGVFILALILAAGCLQPSNGDEPVPEKLVVTAVECFAAGQKCSTGIPRGVPVHVEWEVQYTGQEPVTVQVNPEEANQTKLGFSVLKNFCDVFDIDQSTFTATVSSPLERRDVSQEPVATLQRGESVQFDWVFTVRDGNLSRIGTGCTLDFGVDYTHTATASKQLQVKQDETVPDVTNLQQDFSSPTPVVLRIDAPTTVLQEQPIIADMYLDNTGRGEIKNVTYIQASLHRGTQTSQTEATCSDADVSVFKTGPRRGQSQRLTCREPDGFTATLQPGEQSNVFLIQAESRYTYTQHVGQAVVQVSTR